MTFLGFFFRLFSPHSIWFIGFTTSQNKLILININKYYNITWIIQRFSTHSNGFKNTALVKRNKIQSLPKITSCLALFIMTIFASKYSRWTLNFLATFNIYYRWLLPCFRVSQSKTLIFQTRGLLIWWWNVSVKAYNPKFLLICLWVLILSSLCIIEYFYDSRIQLNEMHLHWAL